ncbi:MAG: hypothetical protein GY789_18250 [Hyphomicrobiales bacterium]|nr:hypothetical protein [Hyphomicrobiales bacterium]
MPRQVASTPVHKARIGLLQMAVWENERDMESGGTRTFRTVTLERSYRDKNGNWKSTSQLNVEDLGGAIKLLEDAFNHAIVRDD